MKKFKQIQHTIFIYCEGKTDHLFACHLKKLYLIRGSKKVTLKKGTGGSISTFISDTIKNAQIRDYDEKYIILDADKKTEKELQETEQQSSQKNIQLIWQKPCLEGLFLQILNSKPHIQETSKLCKNTFYKQHNVDFLTEKVLDELFPKELLNDKRHKIPELDQLIKLMEPRKKF